MIFGECILYPYSDDKGEGLAHISALIYFKPDLEKLPSLHKENTAFKSPCLSNLVLLFDCGGNKLFGDSVM